jgi:HlyD family secretion protein
MWGLGALIVVALLTLGLSRLKPAAPTVDKATLWFGTVERGPMLREVRGLGTLLPEVIQWIPAATDGRVEQRLVLPGTIVKPDTVLLILSNPTLEQSASDAGWQVKGAEADLANLKAQLQNQLLSLQAEAETVQSDFRQSKLQADTNEQLFKLGLTSDLILKLSQVKARATAARNEMEQKRLEGFTQSIDAQLAAQQAKVEELRALAQLKRTQLAELHVRAGIAGVLQELPVEVGQQVSPGTNLARVAEPTKLKAELKIAETQAKDVLLGQKASIDTHNGLIAGRVIRIDPAVQNGTVTVDCALEGALPAGARPDLSVEGTIEIERLTDVLYVGRPVHGEANSTVGLFKLVEGGNEAVRAQVRLGRTSVNTVEILQGLQLGDQVVLSDMSAWDNFDRVRLK